VNIEKIKDIKWEAFRRGAPGWVSGRLTHAS